MVRPGDALLLYTDGREVRRNAGPRGRYRALAVQGQAEARARRPKAAKLAGNARLRGLVQAGLERRWPPEQISAAPSEGRGQRRCRRIRSRATLVG
jgi:IS30 family transposase